MINWDTNLNPRYSEEILQALRGDIEKHLAIFLSWWYKYMPDHIEELNISEEWITYSDLEGQNLTTPQLVVILLEVADFLYKNAESEDLNTIVTKVVKLPKTYALFTQSWNDHESKWDLFWQVPVSHAVYCLSKAFLLLRAKLFQRQTGLYHALFLKTCLMLDRENIAPNFLLWEEYNWLTWLGFVKRYLTPNTDDGVESNIDLHVNIESIDEYPILWAEINDLYLKSFAKKQQERIRGLVYRFIWFENPGSTD
jgi:hypothetical protein